MMIAILIGIRMPRWAARTARGTEPRPGRGSRAGSIVVGNVGLACHRAVIRPSVRRSRRPRQPEHHRPLVDPRPPVATIDRRMSSRDDRTTRSSMGAAVVRAIAPLLNAPQMPGVLICIVTSFAWNAAMAAPTAQRKATFTCTGSA